MYIHVLLADISYLCLSLPGQHNVGSCRNPQLVDRVAPVPDAAGALHHGNELLSNALCKAVLSTAHVPPLRCSRHDPLDGSPSPLPLAQRHGNLKSDTSSSCASLTSNPHQRRDRINGQCEVEHRVEREV